jgi:hypothetical protein
MAWEWSKYHCGQRFVHVGTTAKQRVTAQML